jgi:cytosine deaminase
MIPDSDRYWLMNAHVPKPLLDDESCSAATTNDFALVDLEICDGAIAQIVPAGTPHSDFVPSVDLKQGQVWCCFVDMHTHLDKGHIWGRAPNLDGSFDTAITTVAIDREKHWDEEDVYRRMAFGLKCSYAHGTQAIRTHIDAHGDQASISFSVFKALQAEWANRLVLQAVPLVSLDYFLTSDGEALADLVADVGGVLGGFAQMHPELDRQLDRVFELAKERQLDLDFHADENGDPDAIALRQVAAAALRHEFPRQIVCGHCCSLSVQPPQEVIKTLTLVQQAKIGIVSLPMCNLYLQDRNQSASRARLASPAPAVDSQSVEFDRYTPHWRGVTRLHELKQFGIPVAVANDNCRDPFHAFGDHDMLEVYTQSTRIAHLDAPYGNWPQTVTVTPANLMNLPRVGRIQVGLPANLVLFKARYYSELLSRSQHDRIVVRNGKAIDTTLPDYAELDDLLYQTI